ncbi:MAG: replicative DNA helicase [Candidatus Moranbacteria bacterium]|nr:replicative DNA helicase [Candidatus Moranbacteria bacterium]
MNAKKKSSKNNPVQLNKQQVTRGQSLKLPPQSLDAEKSVLGSLMIDDKAINKVADILSPEDFYEQRNGQVFESMLDLFEKNDPIDLVSLTGRLEDKKKLKQIGGGSYLAELANEVPAATNVEFYAKVVVKKATLRKLIRTAGEIVELGYESDEDVEKMLDQAEKKLFSVSQRFIKQDFVSIKSVLEEAFNRIDDLHKNQNALRGLSTGFQGIDNILAGMQKSDLIILAARPSLGKTTLSLDIMRNIAVKEKKPVAMFSLEMSKDQLIDRMLSSEAGIDLWKLRTGKLSDKGEYSDFQRLGDAMGYLSEAPIFIDDSGLINIMQIRAMARRLQAEKELGLIIIDYLQLMEGRSNVDSRVQEISEISRALKQLARELNIPILALSQLSRAVESRSPQIPRLSDLRESGSIEQDADVVMFIYREDRETPDTQKKNIAEIHIAKHRNGPIGKVDLFFDENSVRFTDLDQKYESAN